MRVWDIAPKHLYRQHLLAEQRELHAIWSILTKNKEGYRYHPETKRWQGKLGVLFLRHEKLVEEMSERGYYHKSPLDKKLAKGQKSQNKFIDHPEKQKNYF